MVYIILIMHYDAPSPFSWILNEEAHSSLNSPSVTDPVTDGVSEAT